ncbi:MAG: lipid-A-disaccharide synthase-related protein, partial [Planktothrix sp.]
NWDIILQGVDAIIQSSILSIENPNPSYQDLVFLAAIASGLDLQPFCQSLTALGWQETPDLRLPHINFSWGQGELIFSQEKARLILTNQAFNDCLALGNIAIAMAGTATEQFVGLGKPAIAIPGEGPQFTRTFANNQQRLLGRSLIIVENPIEIPEILRSLLSNSDQLKLIAENGKHRLGQPGASRRIAEYLSVQSLTRL